MKKNYFFLFMPLNKQKTSTQLRMEEAMIKRNKFTKINQNKFI
jgi:hypothetical protein